MLPAASVSLSRRHALPARAGFYDSKSFIVAPVYIARPRGYLNQVDRNARLTARLPEEAFEGERLCRGMIGDIPADLVRHVPAVFWLSDSEFRHIFYVSPGYETIWGRTCASLYADPHTFFEAVHPDDRARVTRTIGRGCAAELDIEYRIVQPDGAIAWIHHRGSVVQNGNGGPARLAGVATDVTAQKRLEERLFQAVRLESVGRLAGGIAHDFNNLLTVILSQVELTMAVLDPAEPLRQDLAQIRTAAQSGAALTRQLLTIGGKQTLEPTFVDLNGLVDGMLRMLRRVLGEDVVLVANLCPQLPPVWADPGQLQQVVLNLAINAREAMPRGGQLTLGTSHNGSHPPLAGGSIQGMSSGSGGYVQLFLSDTGIGIDAADLPHIFEPFFTTKSRSGGLGLATCLEIVSQSGGVIQVDSQLGRGTTFEVLLPTADGLPTVESAVVDEPLPPGRETILVVEDEPIVRGLIVRMLHKLGYTVVEADDGADALRVVSGWEGTIDLLITDVIMPHMSGPDLARRLTSQRPGLRMLFTSGYSGRVLAREMDVVGTACILDKPYSQELLARTVRQVLDD